MAEGNRVNGPQTLDWLATLLAAALLLASLFLEEAGSGALRVLGVIAFAGAAAFIFPPFILLGKHGRIEEGKSYMHTTAVVDRGLYAVVRHPQYLGYIFLVSGFMLISQHWFCLILGAMAVTCFVLHTVEEERYCIGKMGPEYERYREKVPRFNFVQGLIRIMAHRRTAKKSRTR